MSNGSTYDGYVIKTLVENWRREMEAAGLYAEAARLEKDHRRKSILQKLADVEHRHAKLWEEKLSIRGYDIGQLKAPVVQIRTSASDQLVRQIEDIEQSNATWYNSLRNVLGDEDIVRVIDDIDKDELEHGDVGDLLKSKQLVDKRLRSIWNTERWHKSESGGWLGDAIYGVNDGLGAIFGIIAGVAGFTSNTSEVLVSGIFGALASTLSMGAGAYLSTKSKNELMESEIQQERREIADDPAHELEELGLLYELKGFSPADAKGIADKIGEDPELLLRTMAQEELGIHETGGGNPWKSAVFGSISTLIGGFIPLIPFFFVRGLEAMIAAAVVSIIAHFVVGALKSTMTVRSWWASGLEMTAVGVIVGVVSYALGWIGTTLLHG